MSHYNGFAIHHKSAGNQASDEWPSDCGAADEQIMQESSVHDFVTSLRELRQMKVWM